MSRQCSPNELLEIGTVVIAGRGRKLGKIFSAKWVSDHFGEPICLHEIEFYAVLKRLHGYKYTWQAITPKVDVCNYSGIFVLNKDKIPVVGEVFID